MNLTPTPYESFLEPFETSVFPEIRAEAEHRGSDTRRRDQFVLLGHVGATLGAMQPEHAPPETLEEYAELLYHGFQFWTWGRRLYVFDEAVTAQLTAPRVDLDGWELAGPPSCYLRFPYQRLWARVASEAPFEPVDGCFVVVDETEPVPGSGAHLRCQAVLGLRPDRAGASLVSYRTDLPPAAAPQHAQAPWRQDGEPFANAIPGGERMGYRTIATVSELEALVLRALHHLDRHSRTLVAQPAPGGDERTHLPYTAVHAAP